MKHSPDFSPGTVAMLAARTIDRSLIISLTKEFERRGAVHSVEQTETYCRETDDSEENITAIRWCVTLNDADDSYGSQLLTSLIEDATEVLGELNGGTEHVTATVLPAQQREPLATGSAILVMDVDSTLIDQEVIDILARHANREREVAAVTEQAMRGELDFTESLHHRVAALAGLPLSTIKSTAGLITVTAGADQLLTEFSRRDWPRYAVSGGFVQVLEEISTTIPLSGFHANTLEITSDSTHSETPFLSGKVTGAIVDRVAKRNFLLEKASEHHLTPEHVIAIGDGANDLDMIEAAGIGVAFCAKPALEERADLVIRHRSLELVSLALGLSSQQSSR